MTTLAQGYRMRLRLDFRTAQGRPALPPPGPPPAWAASGPVRVVPDDDGLAAWVYPAGGPGPATVSADAGPGLAGAFALDVGGAPPVVLEFTADPPVSTLPPPAAFLVVSPETLSGLGQAKVTWDVQYATRVTLNNSDVPPAGQLTVITSVTTVFTLAAAGPGGTTLKTAKVTVPSAARHVLPDYVTTPYETIPVFGKDYTHMAVRDGFWDDPEVWDVGLVPDLDARVYVPYGATVTVRDQSAVCLVTLVMGRLTFDPDANTQWFGGTLQIMPEGELEQGTPARPVRADRTSQIVFRDLPLNKGKVGDPYGRGRLYDATKYDRSRPATYVHRWDPVAGVQP